MNILQEHWNRRKIAGLDGIFANTGEVKSLHIESAGNIQAVTSFGKVYKLILEDAIDLNNLMKKYEDDIWSSFDILGELKLDNGNRFAYGEGEMGNEGFIVKLNAADQILWSLYSTTSNPFINSCILENGTIGFFSSFNFVLALSEDEETFPKLDILNPDFGMYILLYCSDYVVDTNTNLLHSTECEHVAKLSSRYMLFPEYDERESYDCCSDCLPDGLD